MDKMNILQSKMKKATPKPAPSPIENEEEEMEMEPLLEEPVKLMVGEREITGQELVDFVLQYKDQIVSAGAADEEERKKLIEMAQY